MASRWTSSSTNLSPSSEVPPTERAMTEMPTESGTSAGTRATPVLSALSVVALIGGLLAACSTDSPPAATPAQQAGTRTSVPAATQTVPATPAGSPALPQGSEPVQLNPANFS